jgi:hypothetical protein
MRKRSVGTFIVFVAWFAHVNHAGSFVVPETVLGTSTSALTAPGSALDVLPCSPSEINRPAHQIGLSNAPRIPGFASLLFEPFSNSQKPYLTASFQQTDGAIQRPACSEHGVGCDRSPPPVSLEP